MNDTTTAKCPNLHLCLLNPFGHPLSEVPVAIEGSQRRTFVTDKTGSISWHETDFASEGKVYVEYEDGGRHLAWSARLPDEPGHYKIYLNVWTNDPDGRE